MRAGQVVVSRSTRQAPVPAPLSAVRTQLVAAIAERVDWAYPGAAIVAVDGRTGAGKTSFGHELAHALAARGRPVLRASLDDFKRPWRDRHLYDRESGDGFYRNAYDYPALRRLLLAPFREGAPEGVVLCSVDPLTQVDHSGSRVPVPARSVLVVDGMFALRPELDPWWDVRVWLDVDAEDSRARVVDRDEALHDGQAGSLHRTRYGAADDIYLREVGPVSRADVVVDNRDLAAPRVLRA